MRCFSCKKIKDESKLTTCRMCDSERLYCKSDYCADLQEPCETCGCEQPGRWTCMAKNEHMLKRGQETHKCVECDEWDYCLDHVVKCECGEGEVHYVCRDGWCESKCRKDNCNVRLCKKGRLIAGIPETLFCDKHIPKNNFKRRLVEAVDQRRKEIHFMN